MKRRELNQFMPIIKAAANKFFNLSEKDSCLYSYEDLIGEGTIRFLILDKKYTEGPAAREMSDAEFGNTLKMDLRDEFMNRFKSVTSFQEKGEIVAKPHRVSYEEILSDDYEGGITMSDLLSVSNDPWAKIDAYHSLSDEAREVADLLMHAPAELLEMTRAGEFSLAIKTYLHKHRGWQWLKIENFWKSLPKRTACAVG